MVNPGLIPVGARAMLVEREERSTELAADGAAVAGEVGHMIGLYVAEHEVAAPVAIITVKTSPVLRLGTAEHVHFNT